TLAQGTNERFGYQQQVTKSGRRSYSVAEAGLDAFTWQQTGVGDGATYVLDHSGSDAFAYGLGSDLDDVNDDGTAAFSVHMEGRASGGVWQVTQFSRDEAGQDTAYGDTKMSGFLG